MANIPSPSLTRLLSRRERGGWRDWGKGSFQHWRRTRDQERTEPANTSHLCLYTGVASVRTNTQTLACTRGSRGQSVWHTHTQKCMLKMVNIQKSYDWTWTLLTGTQKRKWLCLGMQTNRLLLITTNPSSNQFYQPQLLTGLGLGIHYSSNESGQMIVLIMYFCGAHWSSTRLTGATEAPKVCESSVAFTGNLERTANMVMRESEDVAVIHVSESAGMAQMLRWNGNEAAHYFKTHIKLC